MFQSLCGQEALGNVFLTTTHWSNVDPAEGQVRENSLQKENFWGGLIGKGAALRRFNGTRESGLKLIDKLVPKTPKPLDVQVQMVRQNMTLLETNVGKCFDEELIAQAKKYTEEVESLERERQEAMRAKDHEMREILTAEQAKLRKLLDKAVTERKLLQDLHVAEARRREAAEWSRREVEERIMRETEERIWREAEEKSKREAEERSRREAEEKSKREAEERIRREAEKRSRQEAEEKIRRETEEKIWREAEEKSKREAEERSKREVQERSRQISYNQQMLSKLPGFSYSVAPGQYQTDIPEVIIALIGVTGKSKVYLKLAYIG